MDTTRPTLAQLAAHGETRLMEALGLDRQGARLEARMLLCEALGVTRAYLVGHDRDTPGHDQEQAYAALLARRLEGQPMAYILGKREFYGADFMTSPAVLIPRPETELLVDLALSRMPPEHTCRVLDLGTGTGAIALTLARLRPSVRVTAVDRSEDALAVAAENARAQRLDRVRLLRSDWYAELEGETFDIIVSNPPYVAEADPHLKQGDLRFEPQDALASGADGLDAIRVIVASAPSHLAPGGWLLIEHGYDQGERCRELFLRHGFDRVETVADIAANPRVTLGRRGAIQIIGVCSSSME